MIVSAARLLWRRADEDERRRRVLAHIRLYA
jgi:hypothetical protein